MPTLLLFGALTLLTVSTEIEEAGTHSECSRMRQTAMAEFNKTIDEMGMKTAQTFQAPINPDSLFPGDQMLVWRTKTLSWDGPRNCVECVVGQSLLNRLIFIQLATKAVTSG